MMRKGLQKMPFLFIGLAMIFIGQQSVYAQCDPFIPIGSAAYNPDGCITMTDTADQAGCVWQELPFNLNEALDVSITANFGDVDTAGDGICIVLHNDTSGLNACGASGDALGVEGLSPSFIIEYDTRQSDSFNEPATDHIAIDTNGNVSQPLDVFVDFDNLEDGQDHLLRFVWEPDSNYYEIYIDSILAFSGQYDVINDVFGGDTTAIFGYTASTGSVGNMQTLCPLQSDIIDSVQFSICTGDTINVNDSIYTDAGTFVQITPLNNGCDSILVIDIDLLINDTTNLIATICEGDTVLFNDMMIDSAGTFSDTLQNNSGCDSIIILSVIETDFIEFISDATICDGDTFLFNNTPLDTAGTYMDTVEVAVGCDTIFTLNLTVAPNYDISVSDTICAGDTIFFNGVLIDTAGTFSDTLTSVDGCDSIITLTVSLTDFVDITSDITICEGDTIIFNGDVIDSAGTYTDTLVVADACDTVLTLNVTVAPSFDIATDADICQGDTLLFNGIPLTESGIYTDSLSTTEGCDSIITLNLTVLPPDTTELNFNICAGDTADVNGTLYTMGGVFTQLFVNASGCDSTLLINITEFPVTNDTLEIEICTGDTIIYNGMPIDSAGVFVDSSTSVNGCDSIVTLIVSETDIIDVNLEATICEGDTLVFNDMVIDSAGTFNDTIVVAGACDTALTLTVSLAPGFDITLDAGICEGDTLQFNGNDLTVPGTYVDTFFTVDGCDSVITLNLSIIPPDSTEIEVSICAGDTADVNGILYTTGGTFNQLFANAQGCDSVLIINVLELPTTNDTLEVDICDGDTIFFNGMVLDTSGTFVDTFISNAGCDSIVTLIVSITDILTINNDITICAGDSIVFNGNTIDSAGTYTDTIIAEGACDTAFNLNVTVVPAFEMVDSMSICAGDTVIFNGIILTASGTYIDTFTTVDGCDSLVTLNLTVLPTDTSMVNLDLCPGDSLIVNGTLYDSTGTFVQTFENSAGCDSVIIIEIQPSQGVFDTLDLTLCAGDSIEINGEVFDGEGSFEQVLPDSAGCDTILTINIEVLPPAIGEIDVAIIEGKSVEINGETFDQEGSFTQVLESQTGCGDSILTINVIFMRSVVFYDLNECHAITGITNNDYSEFTPDYPQPLDCSEVSATNVFREVPDTNWHSCAPGVDGSRAMCISTVDSCTFVEDDQKAARFEITITPDADEAVQVVGLAFYERAPLEFQWLGGDSGPNNYPTLYGVRILKNGTEVFRQEDVPTSEDWTEESFGFLEDPAFTITESTTFSFELLGYCRVGNGAAVAAWDLDNIRLLARCADAPDSLITIAGAIETEEGTGIEDVDVQRRLLGDPFEDRHTLSTATGAYLFDGNPAGRDYRITGVKDDDPLNGVSTYDLALIQRHILGFQSLESAYKMIAADANEDGQVDIIDVATIRKMILGIDAQFPGERSWLFVNKDQALNSFNPWNFEEYIYYRRLSTDITNADFVGVKLGDVNGSAKGNNRVSGDLKTGKTHVTLRYDNSFVSAGSDIQIPVYAEDVNRMMGMQCAIDFTGLVSLQVTSNTLDIGDEHVNIANNVIRMSWSSGVETSIDKDVPVFVISARAVNSGYISDFLSVNDKILRPEAYPAVGDIRDLHMIASDKQIDDQKYELSASLAPNPALESTWLSLDLTNDEDVEVRIFDAAGKLVHQQDYRLSAGQHRIEIHKDHLGSAGVFYCNVRTVHKTVVRKLVFTL